MKYFLSFAFLIVFILKNQAQLKLDYGFNDSFTVIDSIAGKTMSFPWAGGLNNPQFSKIDANFDEIDDLFVFDRDGNVNLLFVNENNAPNQYLWRLDRELSSQFPKFNYYVTLRDMNCNGKLDAVTASNTNVKVLENTSTDSSIHFETRMFRFYSKQQGVIAFQFDVPHVTSVYLAGLQNEIKTNVDMPSTDIIGVVDMNQDGDMDLLHFSSSGITVAYHENQSIENHGVCDSMDFQLVSSCWGNFSESFLDNRIFLNAPCREANPQDPNPPLAERGNNRHAGTTLNFFDLNGDSLTDLLIGDIDARTISALYNQGSKNNANIGSYDSLFPSYDVPIEMDIMPATYYLDVDNDGIRDLIVAPNMPLISENVNNVWFYKNTGRDDSSHFQLQKKNFLVGEMLDFGSASNPCLVDIDDDGLLDIVVGSQGIYTGSGNFSSSLYFLRNIGTVDSAAFMLVNEDLFGLSAMGMTDLAPAFGDLDGDGDLDLAVGTSTGQIMFFERISKYAAVNTPEFGNGLDVGQHAKPIFYDMDNNGLLDLIAGDRNGRLKLYRNVGSNARAEFSETQSISNFGGVNLAGDFQTGYTSPFISKLDTFGREGSFADSSLNTYLFVAEESGWIYLYDSLENNLSGNFRLVDSLFTGTYRPAIAGGVYSDSGKVDFILGNQLGGISVLQRGGGFKAVAPPVDTSGNFVESLKQNLELKLYPNPAQNQINIAVDLDFDQIVSLHVKNIHGQDVHLRAAHNEADLISLNISGLANGLYIVQLQTKDGKLLSNKFLKH